MLNPSGSIGTAHFPHLMAAAVMPGKNSTLNGSQKDTIGEFRVRSIWNCTTSEGQSGFAADKKMLGTEKGGQDQ